MLQINAAKPGLARRGDGAGRAFKKTWGFCRGVPATHPRTQRLTPRCRILLRTVQSRRRRRGGGHGRGRPGSALPGRFPGVRDRARRWECCGERGGGGRGGARFGSFQEFPTFLRYLPVGVIGEKRCARGCGERTAAPGIPGLGCRGHTGSSGPVCNRDALSASATHRHLPLPRETPSKSGLKK